MYLFIYAAPEGGTVMPKHVVVKQLYCHIL